MINERCWILTGHYKDDLWWGFAKKRTEGTPVSVEFDWEYVLKNHEKVVGFYHTHPSFNATPSETDDRAMHGFCLSLGRPLVCLIRDTDGLRAWWYVDDESEPEEYQVVKMGNLFFGVTPDLYEKNSSHN